MELARLWAALDLVAGERGHEYRGFDLIKALGGQLVLMQQWRVLLRAWG